jgi:hypothetical protein
MVVQSLERSDFLYALQRGWHRSEGVNHLPAACVLAHVLLSGKCPEAVGPVSSRMDCTNLRESTMQPHECGLEPRFLAKEYGAVILGCAP